MIKRSVSVVDLQGYGVYEEVFFGCRFNGGCHVFNVSNDRMRIIYRL